MSPCKSAEPILSISVIALKGKYEGFIELTGMTPEGLKTLNLELEDGGRLPDPNSAQLELVYGNTVITNFYEKTSGRGYWDSGELPDIDLQTDSVFLILDQDGYYQSQSAASDIGRLCRRKRRRRNSVGKNAAEKTCRICKRSFKRQDRIPIR